MSRNGSGTYTLPGIPFVNGLVANATEMNTKLDDIANEMTQSLSRQGFGGMSGQLKLSNGVIGAPAATFTSELTSGLYRNAAGDIRFALLGADLLRLTAALVRIETALTLTGTLNGVAAGFSGNVTVGGTLGVTGAVSLTAGLTVGTTLDVTGVTTLTNNLTVNGATTVVNALEADSVAASGNVQCGTLTCDAAATVGTTLAVTTNASIGGQLDMTNGKIVNLATPTGSTDGATKLYVDSGDALARAVVTFFANNGDVGTSVTRYFVIGGPAAVTASESFYFVVPAAGTVSLLRVYAGTGSTGAISDITVRANGADTALTVQLAAGATSALNAGDTVSVAAGDRLGLQIVAGAGAAGPGLLSASFVYKAS